MKKSLKYREALTDVRRVVVKIGSRVLIQKTGRPDMRRMRILIKQLSALHKAGKEVVVVTSGAVGAGVEALGLGERPGTLPRPVWKLSALEKGPARCLSSRWPLPSDRHD